MDDLGDRMKFYENRGVSNLLTTIPIIARLDGKAFHSYTKGLDRPYDAGLSEMMLKTTKYLVEETNARIGYTQSDEITLIWLADDNRSGLWFDGRPYKMVSVLAAMASVYFNSLVEELLPEKFGKNALFDCRVWNVPTKGEAVNCLIWREQDAVRNSVQMAAQSLYSHKELHGKNSAQLHDLLHAKGVNWNDYPPFFKRGSYVQRKTITRLFSNEEIDKLPEKHEARKNPNLIVERKTVGRIDMPILTSVANREEVVFDGANPVIKQADTVKCEPDMIYRVVLDLAYELFPIITQDSLATPKSIGIQNRRKISQNYDVWEDSPIVHKAIKEYKIKHIDDVVDLLIHWAFAVVKNEPFDPIEHCKEYHKHWATFGLTAIEAGSW